LKATDFGTWQGRLCAFRVAGAASTNTKYVAKPNYHLLLQNERLFSFNVASEHCLKFRDVAIFSHQTPCMETGSGGFEPSRRFRIRDEDAWLYLRNLGRTTLCFDEDLCTSDEALP
jgi:hypothetical protein